MKRLKKTGAWILFCYILAVTNASPGHRTHVPNHGHPRSILSAVPPTIRIPEQLMAHSQEVSCVSADINIFEILSEAKESCKGNDLHVKFYYYSDQKYYNIGSCDVNKELFDAILMKYDHWLITGENINEKDTVTDLPDHLLEILNGKRKGSETAKGIDNVDDLVVSDEQENNKLSGETVDQISDSNARKNDNEIESQVNEENKEVPMQEISETPIEPSQDKDKYENFKQLKPKYDTTNNYFEVFLPKDKFKDKERTINVEIDADGNNYPSVKENDNKPAVNVSDTNVYSENSSNKTDIPMDLTQSVSEIEEKTNIQNVIENNNSVTENNANADIVNEGNEEKFETYTKESETIVDNGNDNNTQPTIDSRPNDDNSESIISSNDINIPTTNVELADNNLKDSSDIPDGYKSENVRSMQNNPVNLKGYQHSDDSHNYKYNPGNKKGVHNTLKQEDNNHISEVLHHNPNENTYPHADIFEDHESSKHVQINGENPYIYNPHDFEDTHEVALHDEHEKHIHLNEPVFKIQGLSRDSDHIQSPYVVKLPKIYSLSPHLLIDNDERLNFDSSQYNQQSQLNSRDFLTSNLAQPNNLDLGELSRTVNPDSQSHLSIQGVPNYYKEDLRNQSPLDMNSNYQSSLPNVYQGTSTLSGSQLNKIKLLNSGSQNIPLNAGYNGFSPYSQFNQPNFRPVPNTKLFTDHNSQQYGLLNSVNDKQIIGDNTESIFDTNTVSVSANTKQPSYIGGMKESPLGYNQGTEANLIPLDSTPGTDRNYFPFVKEKDSKPAVFLGPQQFTGPEAAYAFSDKPNLGKDSSITCIPCPEIGIGQPKFESISPYINPKLDFMKTPYIQNVLNNLQNPYVTNPRFIQPYLQNLLPLSSQQVCPSKTPLPPGFEEINPNLSFSPQNIRPISQIPQNLFWNNPRQYICPSSPSILSAYPLQNLQNYLSQQLPFAIPNNKNPCIPSPLLLNNNLDDHKFGESLLQQDLLETSLINTASIFNKPSSYKPCFENLPPRTLSAERPLLLSESDGYPCGNLPSDNEISIRPSHNLSPLSQISTELNGQYSQGNAQLLPNQIYNEHDITYVNGIPSFSSANIKLNQDIQSANKGKLPLSPGASDYREFHAPIEHLDSSLMPPSIVSPCSIKPSINYGSLTPEIAEILKLSSPNLRPMFYQPKNQNFIPPPCVSSPCFNPDFETQPNVKNLPHFGSHSQTNLYGNIGKQSPLSPNPTLYSPPNIPQFTQTPSQNYLDGSLFSPSSLTPCQMSEFKTQQNAYNPQFSSAQNSDLYQNIGKQPSSLNFQPSIEVSLSNAPNFIQAPSQNYLDSSLLPPSILSPCPNSEFKTQPTIQEVLSQYAKERQIAKLADYISKQPLILNPIQYSRPKIPNFMQAPSQNYLDSSLTPPSTFSPCHNNAFEALPNIQSISQYDRDKQFEIADNIHKQLPPCSKPTHVHPPLQNYVPLTQNQDSSLLPPISPCLNSEIDNFLIPSYTQSVCQSDNRGRQLPPVSLRPVPYSPPTRPNYNAPSQEYVESSLLPPSILPPCTNTEIQAIPFMEGSNFFSEASTGGIGNINQQPTFINQHQPSEYTWTKMPNYNPNLQQLKHQGPTEFRPMVSENICNTPLDAITLNNHPILQLQNSDINRGPSPCAQQMSPLEICEESSFNPVIPTPCNMPSLVSAFPSIFAPKNLQYNTGPSMLNSVSPNRYIDSASAEVSSGFNLASPDSSQFINQGIPSFSPTICPELSSNTESSLPHSYTLPYSNVPLPSSLYGPSLKPLLWPNVPSKYSISSFLPQSLGPISYLPKANSWTGGIPTNILQGNPELSSLSLSTDFSSIPSDYSPHIRESIANLNSIPISPKLQFLNKPFIPPQVFNPYTFSSLPSQSSLPYIPHVLPTFQSILPSLFPSPTSTYMPSPYDSQLQYSTLPFSNHIPQSSSFAFNQLPSIPTSNHKAPCFTSYTDQPTSPQQINVEVMASQPNIKSTAHNSQVNNKEYLSIPQHNPGISSQSRYGDSYPSHLTKPDLDSILQTELPNTSSVSESNTYPYSKTHGQHNDVQNLESLLDNHLLPLDESINMEISVSGGENAHTESGFIHVFANKEFPSNAQQEISKSMAYDQISTDFQINEGPNSPFGITDEIISDNFAPTQSELTESYKVRPLQTKQQYGNTNQYQVGVSADVSLHQSSLDDNDIQILPNSLLPGSSMLSNTQEAQSLNLDITKVATSHIRPSSNKNSAQYTTPDYLKGLPLESKTILSSELQSPSISDLEHSRVSSEFTSKEFIQLDNPFLDSTLQGRTLPNILSNPSATQSSKYEILSIDRSLPYDSRPESSTKAKEYLKDRSYQMLEELPPTYQYIPSSANNVVPQSDFPRPTISSQSPSYYQGPSSLSYLPLDSQLLQGLKSQFDSSLLPSMSNLRPWADTNLPWKPKYTMIPRPETVDTFNPHTQKTGPFFPLNNDLSKVLLKPNNIGNIPQNLATLPYSDFNIIPNGISPYRPTAYPCGLNTIQSTAPMRLPPSFYSPQDVFSNLLSNKPIYNPYLPIFNSEKPVSEFSPCLKKLNKLLADETPYTVMPQNYQTDSQQISPCAIENSPLSTSNIYLPSPCEMSQPESLYSSEYMPVVSPTKSIPQFTSYSESQFGRPSDKFSYPRTISAPIPNNQYTISDDSIQDSRHTLPDFQSLEISNAPLIPIGISSPFTANRLVSPPISIVSQYNIRSPIPQVCTLPIGNQKVIPLPCPRLQTITYTSPPLNTGPTLPCLPLSITPISQPLPPIASTLPIWSSPSVYTTPILPCNAPPIQPCYLKPQLLSRPKCYLKPSLAVTIPQYPSYSSPVSPTYSTPLPAPTPICLPSTIPPRLTPCPTNAQFTVIPSPSSYITPLPATASILPCSIPRTPCTPKAQFPVNFSPMSPCYTTTIPEITPILPPCSVPCIPSSINPQFPVKFSPISPSYTTIMPAPTPILAPCTTPCIPSYIKPQFPVNFSPISKSYTTITPPTTPILTPCPPPFIPSSTNPQFPIKIRPMSSIYTTIVPEITPILPPCSIPCIPSSIKPQFPVKYNPISPCYTTIMPAPTPILAPCTNPYIPSSTNPKFPVNFSPMSPSYTTIVPEITPILPPCSNPCIPSLPKAQFPVQFSPSLPSYTTILPAPSPILAPCSTPYFPSSTNSQFPVKFRPMSPSYTTIVPEITPLLQPCSIPCIPSPNNPQFPVKLNPISPYCTTILPAPTPILSPCTTPCIPTSTNPQFPVNFSPISPCYTSITPATTPILAPCTAPCIPSSISPIKPCRSNLIPISPCYLKPTPNYIRPCSESYSYPSPTVSTYQFPPCTTNSLSPYVQPATTIKRILSNTYATPISPVLGPQSKTVPLKYSNSLPSEYINSVLTDYKPILKNPFIQSTKYTPLPQNELSIQYKPNMAVNPCLQPLKYTPQVSNIIPQNVVLYPTNIKRPAFIKYLPQSMPILPLLSAQNPANLAINEPVFSYDNICQENYETGQNLNIPLPESPIEILDDIESIKNENAKANTGPIPINLVPNFNQQLSRPCSLTQSIPYTKLPFSTSAFNSPCSHQNIPRPSVLDIPQSTLPSSSSSGIPTSWIRPPVPSSPELTLEELPPSYLEYPYNMGPIDIRREPLKVDNQPYRYYSSLPSTTIPNYQETNYELNPTLSNETPNEQFKPTSTLSSNNLQPRLLPTWPSNLPNFVSHAPQSFAFTSASKFPLLPSYAYPPNMPSSFKLPSCSSSVPPSVAYPEQVPTPLENTILQPSTATYNSDSMPINDNYYSYPSQKQLLFSPQYLKPWSVPLQVPKLSINAFTPSLRPCYSQYPVPSSVTSPLLNIDSQNPDLIYNLSPQYLTPQTYLNKVAPSSLYPTKQSGYPHLAPTQGIPICSEPVPCPLSGQDNIQAFEPLVSESLISQDYLDSQQSPPSSTFSALPKSLDQGFQFTPKPCSLGYRQVDLPKELKDLLQKMTRPKFSNYQYPATYPFSINQFGQLPQPILDTPLSNVDVSEIQPMPASSGIFTAQPSPQLLPVMDLNNLQNTVANSIPKPILPQYTTFNLPSYGSPISSLNTPLISSMPRLNYISSPESSNPEHYALPETLPVPPCISPCNKPLINSFATQETQPIQYFRPPTATVPTDLNLSQESYPLPLSPRPLNRPKWFTLPYLPFIGNNNKINPFKQLPSSLQGPIVSETICEDIGKVPIPYDGEYSLSPVQSQTNTEYAPSQLLSLPSFNPLPPSQYTTVVNEYQYLPNIPQNKFIGNRPCSPYYSSASNPEYSYAPMSPAELLTLSEDVSSPSMQPCSQIKPSQMEINQPPFNLRPAYQQFGPPQLIPPFISPYSYNSKQNPSEKQLPTSTSQNMLPLPTYPYTPDINLNAPPIQLQPPLSFSNPYLISDIQKILGPIANPSSSKYKNPASFTSDVPLPVFESSYTSPSSDFEMSPSPELALQYIQFNPIQQLQAAIVKDRLLQAAKYPHFNIPCDKLKVEEMPFSADVSSSVTFDNLPCDFNVDIQPNSFQIPQLSTIVTPQYSTQPASSVYSNPQQQDIPLNTVSSSYIPSPSSTYLPPSILSKRLQLPSFNIYPETLPPIPCQNPLPPQIQHWSQIPNIPILPPRFIQPRWYQNEPYRIPEISKNPYEFNSFTPIDYDNINPSQIPTPQLTTKFSEVENDKPEENTIYVNLNYTESPLNETIEEDRLKENEIDNSEVVTETTEFVDLSRSSHEENGTGDDFNPYEYLNHLQGPNPENEYTLRQERILAPLGKSISDDYIFNLNIPNISMDENSIENIDIERVKLPSYVYNANIDNILRNGPKYEPINNFNSNTGYKFPPMNINMNQYNNFPKIPTVDTPTPYYLNPIEYKTYNNEIQKPAPFNLYPNLYNAPNQGTYTLGNYNNVIPDNLQEFNNQPLNNNYKIKPQYLNHNRGSPEISNDFTEIPSTQYNYYPQFSPDYPKNTYPQILKPLIASSQTPSFEPYKFLDEPNDNSIPPCSYKPCQTGNIKYSGYKTYQMPNSYPNVYQEPLTMNGPTTQPCKTDYKIPIQNAPCQANVDYDNWQQSSNLNGVNNLPVGTDNEIKTSLINYLKQSQREDAETKELAIPIRKFAIVNPLPCSEQMIQTKNPSLGLKVWKSNIKVVEAEIKLRFKDLSVINFMPIVNNLDDFDIEEIKNIVKSYINEKYGNHYDVSEPYVHNKEYQVIREIDRDLKYGKYTLLWPTKCLNA